MHGAATSDTVILRRHETPASAPVGSSIPRRHERRGGLSRGGRGEFSEKRSWAERRGEAPVMRRGAQGPHMHVEFVGQDLKRHSIMSWPLRLQRPRLTDDSLWRGPSAGIPGSECFDRDAKSRRALRVGQTKPRPNLPQVRGAFGHRSRRCHRSAAD